MCWGKEMMVKEYIAVLHASSLHFWVPRAIQAHINEVYERVGKLNWILYVLCRRTGGPTRRSSKGGWTPEEDEVLRRAVQWHKGKNWKKIGKLSWP
jgi:hypothetical protein